MLEMVWLNAETIAKAPSLLKLLNLQRRRDWRPCKHLNIAARATTCARITGPQCALSQWGAV